MRNDICFVSVADTFEFRQILGFGEEADDEKEVVVKVSPSVPADWTAEVWAKMLATDSAFIFLPLVTYWLRPFSYFPKKDGVELVFSFCGHSGMTAMPQIFEFGVVGCKKPKVINRRDFWQKRVKEELFLVFCSKAG